MTTERDQIERAIAAVEQQRSKLGNAATDAALEGLRDRLASLVVSPSGAEKRKQITVLFAEVAGLASLADTLDAEDVTEVMNSIWRHLDAVIRESGGVIDKHISGVVMAIWGAEAAREDDAERAVHAALMLQKELDIFAQTKRGATLPPLQVRSGINTGLALLGEVGSMGEFTAMGDAVNVASRLQNAATLGTTLISYDTYRHVRGVFEVIEREKITVKGKSEPLEVLEVVAVRPRGSRVGTRGVEGINTNMVGRDDELQALQNIYRAVIEEQAGHVVTVFGDAGIGKSRLVNEFSEWLESQPDKRLIFKGRASEPMVNVPFSLISDMLSLQFDIQDSDSDDRARTKFEQGVSDLMGPNSQAQAHFVGQLVGVDFSNSPHLAGIRSDVEQVRTRAFWALGQVFRAAAEQSEQVLIAILDDVHWADEGSMSLVEHIMQECRTIPLMIICLARPTLYESHPTWGWDQTLHSGLHLTSLKVEDSSKLVDDILQHAKNIPDILRELIIGRAEGNPFYIEELVKMLIDDEVIVSGEGEWMVQPWKLADAHVPPTLMGVVQARLDSLPVDGKLILQKAAVVGRTFWDTVLERVGEGEVIRTDTLLQDLVDRELIIKGQASSFAGSLEYSFKNTILLEVTYESVLKRLRRLYHGQVAEWLEQQRGERIIEHIGLIAEHYERAEDAGKALEYLNAAGEQALRKGGNREGITYLERGLALASGEFSSSLLNAKQWQALLNAQLGRGFMSMGEMAMAAQHNESSLTLAREVNDRAAIARGLLGLAAVDYRTGNNQGASTRLDECLRIFKDIDDETGIIDTLQLMGDIAVANSEADKGSEYYEQAIRAARELGDKMREASVMSSHAMIPVATGNHVLALPRLEACLKILRELDDKVKIANTHTSIGTVASVLGDFARARENFLESLSISQQVGDRQGVTQALVKLGEIAFDAGDFGEARRYSIGALREGIAILYITRLLYGLYTLARLTDHDGKPEVAAQWMGLILDHPAVRSDLARASEPFIDDLKSKLGDDGYHAAVIQGTNLDLADLIDDILNSDN